MAASLQVQEATWPHNTKGAQHDVQRMDNVLIVVDDLDAVIAFFVELGMELEGKGPIAGRWVERVIGIDDVRQDVAMLKTPDGHGRIELAMFHTPKAISPEPGVRCACPMARKDAPNSARQFDSAVEPTLPDRQRRDTRTLLADTRVADVLCADGVVQECPVAVSPVVSIARQPADSEPDDQQLARKEAAQDGRSAVTPIRVGMGSVCRPPSQLAQSDRRFLDLSRRTSGGPE